MEFALEIDNRQYEVRLVGANPELQVGDMLRRYGGDAGTVIIDGCLVSGDRPVASVLRPGSVVDATASPAGPVAEQTVPATGRAFNRPPRSEFPVALPPLAAPATLESPRSQFRFGWATIVVPVVMGLVLAIVIHPRMALFAIFSPAMVLANWIEHRRRASRGARRRTEELRGELATFRARLIVAVRAEEHRRRRAHPGLDELTSWAGSADGRLWERRRHHGDAMSLAIGTACVPWAPDLVTGYGAPAHEVAEMIESLGMTHDVPVEVTLRAGAVVGIAGGAARRRALACSLLVQTAVLHGPSDVQISIVTDSTSTWDWAKWLPHVLIDPQTRTRRLAGTPDDAAVMLSGFARAASSREHSPAGRPEDRPFELLIVDVQDLAHSAHAAVRNAIERSASGGGSAVILAGTVSALSSRCRVIVELDDDATAVMRIPDRAIRRSGIASWAITPARSRAVARRLAGIVDPDMNLATAELPEQIRLVELLGMTEPTPDGVTARWAQNAGCDTSVPVGVSAAGAIELGLVADGPHALLAGTTGSGKSEFLRSLVVSLAASHHPDELTLVLVDYKGGSAFDVCARLPHTVGLVTDLDGHLAQRALTCLEAELRYREEELRSVGAADLVAYRASSAQRPLPRLFVVVDEFAALAKELPDFMTSLVDVAQRGRSLGVHLLLATQRPQGVINDQIRANTNVRIALRVQDPSDSTDVIGTRGAAEIGRTQAGRGYIRLGAGEIQMFQAALVTGPSAGPPDPELRPFVFAPEQPEAEAQSPVLESPTDLDTLVAAITAAHLLSERPLPRRPWPEPLPTELLARDIAVDREALCAVLGLADEPSRQRQCGVTWTPLDGSMLLYGVAGSGTTTAMATIAIGLAQSTRPDDLHIYVLDFDDQLLAPLRNLAHSGGVVGAADRERQARLVRMLQGEINRRRQAVSVNPSVLAEMPTIVLLIDNYAGFAAAFDDPSDLAIKSALVRVIADGPGVGMVSIISAKQPVDVPAQISSLLPAKLLFRLSDRYEYAGLGVAGIDPPADPGRCYESWSGREVHIARHHPDGLGAAVALIESTTPLDRPPAPVGVLPTEVKVSQLHESASVDDLEWYLPVGIGDAELAPIGFRLGDGDHVVISGPARSGKSTALATMARVAKTARPDLRAVAIAPRRSSLRGCTKVDALAESAELLADELRRHDRVLVLIDDAAMVDDVAGLLAELADRPRPGVHVIAAAPADLLRSAYGHWTAGLRRSRLGLALKPNPAADGDLWQTSLPRRGPTTFPQGRGYLLTEGHCELVQVAGT